MTFLDFFDELERAVPFTEYLEIFEVRTLLVVILVLGDWLFGGFEVISSPSGTFTMHPDITVFIGAFYGCTVSLAADDTRFEEPLWVELSKPERGFWGIIYLMDEISS